MTEVDGPAGTGSPTATGPGRRRSIVSAGGLRGGAIVARAAVGLVLARLLGAAEVGEFFLAVAVGVLVALVTRAGLDRLALSEVGRRPEAARAITIGLGRHLVASSLLGTAIGLVAVLLVPLPVDLDRTTLAMAVAAVVPLNLVQLTAHALRGVKRTTAALLIGELGPPALRLVVFVVLPMSLSATRATAAFLIGWVVVAAVGLVAVIRLPAEPGGAPWALANPWRQTGPLFTFSLASQLRETVATGLGWVVGTPAEVGGLGTATRMEQMSLLPTSATRFVTAPDLVSSGSRLAPSTVAVAVRTARKALVVQVPVLVTIALFAPQILGLLGDDFRSAAPYLRVMLLGALVNSLTGSTTQVLLMSDNRRRLARSSTIGLIVLALVALATVPSLGVAGVAVGLAAANAAIGLAEWWSIRSELGVRVDVFAPGGGRR